MTGELFPPTTRVPANLRELMLVLAVAARLDSDVELLGYRHDQLDPWLSFDAGARRFAIWRATGELYEADETGAMGDDPIALDSLGDPDQCPFCDFRLDPGLDERERAHAEAEHIGEAHPEIVAERLEGAGFRRDPDSGEWIDRLSSGD